MDEREDTVGRLLEGTTNFSRDERDEIFDGVFAAVEAEQADTATAGSRVFPGWLRWVGLAAAIALAVVPMSFLFEPEPPFTARGEEGNIELICPGEDGCQVGETLSFQVVNPPHRFMAAFARSADGRTVWYFPESADGRSLEVGVGLVERSVVLDDTHGVGTWVVHFVFSPGPWSREDVRERFGDDGEFVDETAELRKRTFTLR